MPYARIGQCINVLAFTLPAYITVYNLQNFQHSTLVFYQFCHCWLYLFDPVVTTPVSSTSNSSSVSPINTGKLLQFYISCITRKLDDGDGGDKKVALTCPFLCLCSCCAKYLRSNNQWSMTNKPQAAHNSMSYVKLKLGYVYYVICCMYNISQLGTIGFN